MKKLNLSLLIILVSISIIGFVGCKDPEPAHEHEFSDSWSKDGTYHWHAATCEHTTEVSEKAEHTFGNWTTTKEATEEAEGSKERTCTVCGHKVTEVIAKLEHKHTFAEEWTIDSSGHWHASTCGHEVTEGKAAHTFEWEITQNPTETEKGEKTGTCTVCGYTATEVIAKLEHKHTYSEDWTKDATHHWHASTCGHEVTEGKAAHTFGEYVSNNDATTEADGTKTRECSVCGYKDTVTDEGSKIIVPEMVSVKGGTVVGAKNSNNYEGVFIEGRTVILSDFYMGKYEVTQEEYASVMKGQKVTVNGTDYALESNPSYCTADSSSYTLFNGDEQKKRPVEGVTWYDAVWYCNALSEKEGLTKAYNIEVTQVSQASGKTGYYIYGANVTLNKNATGYRLPTEAEWEYAARGGDPNAADWNYTFSGADTAADASYSSSKNSGLDNVGWYWYNTATGTTGNSPSSGSQGYGTHQVGKKAANALGLYDMSGNVWEWCYDWYGTVNTGTETAPTGAASGSYRVYRGGGWGNLADGASVSCRSYNSPYPRYNNHVFRVVRPSSN